MDPRIVSRTREVDVLHLSRLLRSVADHCAQVSGGDLMARARLDPAALPRDALPWIMLFDVLPGPDYRARLQGTALREAYGLNLTGKLLSEIETWEPQATTYAFFHAAVRSRRPVATVCDAVLLGVGVSYERLLVPLAGADGSVGFVLVCFHLRDFPPYVTAMDLLATPVGPA